MYSALVNADMLNRVYDKIIGLLPPEAWSDHSTNPNLVLTNTPQLVTGWVEELTPVGITESGGTFTANVRGIYNIMLERIYMNADTNPALLVNLTIRVDADDQQGGGFLPIFERTAPIMSATANNEPAVLSFMTPSNREILAGTQFRVYVSAEDGGGNPQEATLVRAKIVTNLIHTLPVI